MRNYTWTTIATFTVLDENDQPVEGANVSSFPLTMQTVADICITNALGKCNDQAMTSSYADQRFWVSEVYKALMTYNETSNTDPDGDSDGTIVMVQPSLF